MEQHASLLNVNNNNTENRDPNSFVLYYVHLCNTNSNTHVLNFWFSLRLACSIMSMQAPCDNYLYATQQNLDWLEQRIITKHAAKIIVYTVQGIYPNKKIVRACFSGIEWIMSDNGWYLVYAWSDITQFSKIWKFESYLFLEIPNISLCFKVSPISVFKRLQHCCKNFKLLIFSLFLSFL